MKIWEKIYLIVMVVFLTVVGITNALVFRSSYQNSVEAIENAGILGWKRIAVALSEDLNELEKGSEEEWDLFQNYVSVYGTDVQAFEIWEQDILLYRSGFGTQATFSSQEEKLESEFQKIQQKEKEGQISVIEKDGEKYTCTSGILQGTDYHFVIYEKVTDVLQVWKDELVFFVLLELVVALVMALLLYIIMRRFLRPLTEISQATARIASGNYEHRIMCKGKDELSLLAADINMMSEKVQEYVAEKEQEAEKKQEFIDALSHELRTPLTSVKGYAQLVQNASLSEEKRQEYMTDIVQEAERMMAISETLRDVILMRQDNIDKKPIKLSDLEPELRRYMRIQPEVEKIDFVVQASEGTIEANSVLLEELLYNLLRNSIRACDGNGKIVVTLSEKEMVVEDNGIGMTEETMTHIFEPFYREDKARSRKSGGSGLGMYLCKQIIEKHNWQIEIQSEKGKGTKIRIYNFFTTL